jgi:hypothetical protein
MNPKEPFKITLSGIFRWIFGLFFIVIALKIVAEHEYFPAAFIFISQFGKLIILIREKMTHKGENYSVKLQKYYFCNGTGFTTIPIGFTTTIRRNVIYHWCRELQGL